MRLTNKQIEIIHEQALNLLEEPTKIENYHNVITNTYFLLGMIFGFIESNQAEDDEITITEKYIKENFEVDNDGLSDT